jgi:hypothetical protein
MDANQIGTIIAVILTVLVYTYLIGDNVVFRLMENILVGVSVGWAILQIFYNLLLPSLKAVTDSAQNGVRAELITVLIPLVLGILLLTRPLRASKTLTNLIMALVIGVVAALSLAGALSGTLLPQVGASMGSLGEGDIFGRIVMLIGTVVALWYFQFTVFKPQQAGAGTETTQTLGVISDRLRLFGRWSIMLAFGAVFASVFLTYFAALMDRVLFLFNLKF